MKLNDYVFIAGKNGTSGIRDMKSELDIMSYSDLKSMDSPFYFAGGSIVVPILLDFRREVLFEKVVVTFSGKSDGIEKIDFSIKSDRKENYRVISTETLIGNKVTLEMAETGRFLKLLIYREQWEKVSPEIEVTGSSDNSVSERLSDQDYRMEWICTPPKVDRYGQYLYEEWPGKIHSDEDLIARYEEEKEYLKNTDNSKYEHDEYGGILDGNNYGGTGFFRTQKIDGKWWLITPLGNKFIIKGTEAANLANGPGLSRLCYAGTDIIRSVFKELPNPEEFPEIYCLHGADKGKSVSLLLANIIKKYGREKYLELWRETTLKRLKKWNFNAHAKWTKDEGIKLPYICSLGLNKNFSKILYAADPYDENFEKNVIEAVEDKIAETKDDPLLIGYHFTNESGWTPALVKTILESDGTVAAKRAFVEYIAGKYDNEALSEKFEVAITESQNLKNIPLKIEALSGEEINEFIFLSSVKFHSTVQKVFKALAPNHLYMGGGLPGSNWHNSIAWTEGSADYCDVITFDRYSKDKTAYLKPYLHIDKPMANIEWSFISTQRGYSGGALLRVACKNQAERAELYKEFLEENFKVPQFVGMGWFLHYDQPLTGRAIGSTENAECYNFGLIDMQDTPYYEFVDKIALVNDELERIHEKG